jgi:hypothetical protein
LRGFHRFAAITAWTAQILVLLLVLALVMLVFIFGGLFVIPFLVSLAGLALLHLQLRRESGYSRAGARLERRAANAEPEACFQMGMAYQRGTRDYPRDHAMAKEWLQRAAEAGHIQAMTELGDLLAWDVAGRRDPEAARRWLQKAAQLGDVPAQVKLGRLAAESETQSP